jgi:plastocyanin
MRIYHKNILVASVLALMIFSITACSTSMKENSATASNSQQSETAQSASDSVAPSTESASEPQQTEDKVQAIVVEIKDFAFSPNKVTIRKGSTVTFINRDNVKHTATADGGGFDTGLLGKDVSGNVKFDEAGTFTFHCSPHPGMTGTIVVEDK